MLAQENSDTPVSEAASGEASSSETQAIEPTGNGEQIPQDLSANTPEGMNGYVAPYSGEEC